MYRIILTKNGKYKSTLHRCKKRETSFIKYNELLDENERIIFKRKFINYNKIIPVKYKIYIVKDIEDGDEPRLIRDELGRVKVEKPIFNLWTIVDDRNWDIEETFWLFGKSPVYERVDIGDILKLIVHGANNKKITKQVIIVHNKLVIHNENQFDMVICKNKNDATRLHHEINKACINNKIKNIIFMGTAKKANVSLMYEIIKENTGWVMEKIRRTSTRP